MQSPETSRRAPLRQRRVHALLGLIALALLSGLAHSAAQVMASSRPLHSLLAGLMAGVGEPVLLIEAAIPPWEVSAGDELAGQLRNADLVVWTGPELEPGLAPVLGGLAGSTRVYEVLASDALKILPDRAVADGRDPFFWLDTRNMLILLDELAGLLAEVDPARGPVYERNRRVMAQRLGTLDRTLEFRYRDVSGIPLFLYHDNQQYFEQAYAMRVGATASRTGADAAVDAGRLLAMAERMRQAGRSCLFTELGLAEPHLDLVSNAGAVSLVELDSLGLGLEPGPDLYVELMQRNFSAISDCVRKLRPGAEAGHGVLLEPDLSESPAHFAPRYALRDPNGRAVSSEDFAGRLQLIYFGYTYCPDVCPTSLAVMSQALRQLGADADQIQPIFVTVDPERDTPQMLAEYTAYFHPRLLGLTGSAEAIKRTAELFRARYEFVAAENGDPGRYTVDHTASLFVLGRQGEYLTKFAHGLPAVEVAARLLEFLHD
jgi:protein SCO1/2